MADLNYASRIIHKMDNIIALRRTDTASVDLVYLDPPFNTDRIFERPIGSPDFSDKWSIGDRGYRSDRSELRLESDSLSDLIDGISDTDADIAYLHFMAIRIIEIRRVLKDTGTMVLHCDDEMDSHLRIICNKIFGRSNFRNETIWKRSHCHGTAENKQGRIGDRLLAYTKKHNAPAYFEPQFAALKPSTIRRYNRDDNDGLGPYKGENLQSPSMGNYHYEYRGKKAPPKGWNCPITTMEEYDRQGLLVETEDTLSRKKWLSESQGRKIGDIWDDIEKVSDPIYETEKPLALLNRVIDMYCPDGGVIFDPFCGCATACVAAEWTQKRTGKKIRWIGADLGRNAELAILERLTLSDKEVRLRSKRRKERQDPEADRRDLNAAQGEIKRLGIGRSYWKGRKMVYIDPLGTDYDDKEITRGDIDPITDALRNQILGEQDYRCAETGERLDKSDPKKKPSLDHIIPVDRGGTDERSNLRYITAEENSRKSNRPATTTHAR